MNETHRIVARAICLQVWTGHARIAIVGAIRHMASTWADRDPDFDRIAWLAIFGDHGWPEFADERLMLATRRHP